MERSMRTGWVVTLAGTGINLALGILYAWSVIKNGIPDSWGWTNADKALPYSVAAFCFALAMVPAGWLQDKIGPKKVAAIGGILVGAGCIFAAFSGSSLLGFVIGFGIMTGMGIGFGYASATPPAVKWFPPDKTGLIAGIVVAGFGLASVYIAPLASILLDAFQTTSMNASGMQTIEKGVSNTMLVFGISFLIVVVGLSQLLKNPPVGYVTSSTQANTGATAVKKNEMTWKQMISTGQFWIMWLMYFGAAGAGLMFISVAADLGKKSLGELAFIAVAVLAVGNASGRILAGSLSDKIGRQSTLFIVFIFQAIVVLLLSFAAAGASWGALWLPTLLLVILIGANYGANLAIFPALTKDYFGLKNFGLNYGLVFTSWGVAGLAMPWINGIVKDMGKPHLAYWIIIAVLVTGACLTFVSKGLANKR